MSFPVLTTDRLVLNELEQSDTEHLFSLFSDEKVVEYYDIAVLSEIEQAKKILDIFQNRYVNGEGIRWAIRNKATNKFIGTCGFNSWKTSSRTAVIGYDLLPEFWNQGYITEAVNAAVRYAFSGKLACGELNRIQADTVPGNIASEKVLHKLGFKEEGLLRESGYWKGQYHDLKCFGLLKREFNL